jgi:hypothetical protein
LCKIGFLTPATPGEEDYVPRIIFDSAYFVWVGIVLMNVITGLMVDEFASLREEKETRSSTLESSCFVCGLERDVYEELGLSAGGRTFAEHLAQDHDIWSYVFFICYLMRKDTTEYNGIESYIRGQLDSSALEWVPSKNSFEIELQGASPAEGSTGNRGVAKRLKTTANLSKGLDVATALIAATEKTMRNSPHFKVEERT